MQHSTVVVGKLIGSPRISTQAVAEASVRLQGGRAMPARTEVAAWWPSSVSNINAFMSRRWSGKFSGAPRHEHEKKGECHSAPCESTT